MRNGILETRWRHDRNIYHDVLFFSRCHPIRGGRGSGTTLARVWAHLGAMFLRQGRCIYHTLTNRENTFLNVGTRLGVQCRPICTFLFLVASSTIWICVCTCVCVCVYMWLIYSHRSTRTAARTGYCDMLGHHVLFIKYSRSFHCQWRHVRNSCFS